MLNNVKQWFKDKINGEERMVIGSLAQRVDMTDTHFIALARLLFIQPKDLVREAKNTKANGEYLLKMIEARENEEKGK